MNGPKGEKSSGWGHISMAIQKDHMRGTNLRHVKIRNFID